MSHKEEDPSTLPTFATVPKSVEGLVDAAFRMVEEGQDPSDVLKMVGYSLKKSRPTPEQ